MKFPKIYIFDLAKKKGCWTNPVGLNLYSFLNLTYGYKSGKKTNPLPAIGCVYNYRFYNSSKQNEAINLLYNKKNPACLKNWVITGACLHGYSYEKDRYRYIAVYIKPSK